MVDKLDCQRARGDGGGVPSAPSDRTRLAHGRRSAVFGIWRLPPGKIGGPSDPRACGPPERATASPSTKAKPICRPVLRKNAPPLYPALMQWARGHRSARILRRARAVPLIIAALTLAGFAVPSSASANSAPICRAADTQYVTLPDGSYRWELGDMYEELMFTCADPEKQPMTVQVTQAPQRGGASGNYDPRALPDAYLIDLPRYSGGP